MRLSPFSRAVFVAFETDAPTKIRHRLTDFACGSTRTTRSATVGWRRAAAGGAARSRDFREINARIAAVPFRTRDAEFRTRRSTKRPISAADNADGDPEGERIAY